MIFRKVGPWYFWILVCAYAPAFVYSFAHHDQYRYFRVPASEKTSCAEDSQFYGLLFDLGRPVSALLECVQFKLVNTLSDLTWCRLVMLGLILTLAFLLSRIFHHRWGFGRETAGLLAVSICVLPGMLNFFVMASETAVVALILGTLSFSIYDQRWKNQAIAFLLFLIGLFTYPAAAFVLIGLAFADCLFTNGPRREALRRLISINLLAVVGSILFFSAVKFVLHPYSDYDLRHPKGEGWGGATYAFSLSTDLLGRLGFFVRAMGAVFNFWNLYTSVVVSSILFAFLLFLVVRRFFIKSNQDMKWKVAVALIGFFATFAPVLFAGIQELLFRTLTSISAYALLVLVWLYRENFSVWPSMMRITVAAVVILSSFNLFMTAQNSSLELGFLRSQIQERGLLNQKVLLIKNLDRSQATKGFNGLPSVSDEFNVNSTLYYDFENTWILRAALIEAGAPTSTHVVSCAGADDCVKAEAALRSMPNVYVISRGADFTGYPTLFPVIDLAPFSN
ncbi:MAG: hypothetical protein AB7F86_12365 [Bdellovibrionales bacterium]